MLEIINKLGIFFEDCYREVSVREYSREMKISPPTASKLLKEYEKQELLIRRGERGFLLFRINRESKIILMLSRIYWSEKLKPLFDYLEKTIYSKAIVLFGSLSKLETRKESDIDILVISDIKKDSNLKQFEKLFNREIQLFIYPSLEKINKDLKSNIVNAYIARGYLS